mgnify:CR=1 FL=1
MKLDLTGQRALVTGGASGIGATVARRFASLGAHVIVTDLNDITRIETGRLRLTLKPFDLC